MQLSCKKLFQSVNVVKCNLSQSTVVQLMAVLFFTIRVRYEKKFLYDTPPKKFDTQLAKFLRYTTIPKNFRALRAHSKGTTLLCTVFHLQKSSIHHDTPDPKKVRYTTIHQTCEMLMYRCIVKKNTGWSKQFQAKVFFVKGPFSPVYFSRIFILSFMKTSPEKVVSTSKTKVFSWTHFWNMLLSSSY